MIEMSLVKIEFRKFFKIEHNSKMTIIFEKGKGENNNGKHYIELLNYFDFTNSLLTQKEFLQQSNLFKNIKYEERKFPKEIDLNCSEFNNSQKKIHFEYENDDPSKLIEFEIRQIIDKSIRIQINITNSKEKIILYGE